MYIISQKLASDRLHRGKRRKAGVTCRYCPDFSIIKDEAMKVFLKENRRHVRNFIGAFERNAFTLCTAKINMRCKEPLPCVFLEAEFQEI